MEQIQLIPRAASFFDASSDLGYTLDSAVADIIDNSLSAGASNIDIAVEFTPSYTICILDNGHGMTKDELIESMRHASRDPREKRDSTDLGRFGLGLKFASLSQCKKLTVVTRKNGQTSASIWDKDHVDDTNDWMLQIPVDSESIPYADQLKESGTMVLWEKMRVAEQGSIPANTKKEIVAEIDACRSHLELVFHRFLSGDGVSKCEMRINNEPLEPFEPFNTNHPATMRAPVEKIGTDVSFQVFTLPHHTKVTPAEWERFGRAEGYLKNQGLYIYRENRLIIHGTWLRLMRQTNGTNLTRVKIDITNQVDREWGITLDKSSAKLPLPVRDRLRNVLDTIGRPSREVYTQRGRRLTMESLNPAWYRVQGKGGSTISYEVNADNPVIDAFLQALSPDLQEGFKKTLDFVSSSMPVDALYADLGNDPSQMQSDVSDENLRQWALDHYDFFLKMSDAGESQAIDNMRSIEPFRTHWDRTQIILNEERGLND